MQEQYMKVEQGIPIGWMNIMTSARANMMEHWLPQNMWGDEEFNVVKFWVT